jgi:hypothetical protein
MQSKMMFPDRLLLSLHQRKLISQAADSLSPSQRGNFIAEVATRLSKCIKYRDVDVARACNRNVLLPPHVVIRTDTRPLRISGNTEML